MLNFDTLQGYEIFVGEPIHQQGVIPLWIVSPDIDATTYLYVYNVGGESSGFDVVINDKVGKENKELSFTLDSGTVEVIDISTCFNRVAQGNILIYAENGKFIGKAVILSDNSKVVTNIEVIEKTWK